MVWCNGLCEKYLDVVDYIKTVSHNKELQNIVSIIHQNINSLKNKVDQVEHFLNEVEADIVVLTEHGMRTEELSLTKIQNYKLVSKFTREKHKLGGVSIYAKNNLIVEKCDVLNDLSKERCAELAVMSIKCNMGKLKIVGIYRPPSGCLKEFFDILEQTLEKVGYNGCKIIITGDLNIDSIKQSHDYVKLKNIISSYGINQLSSGATRITSSSATAIDYVLSNINPELTELYNVNSNLSDHMAQCVILNDYKPEKIGTQYSQVRILSTHNLQMLKSELSNQTWNTVFDLENTDRKWEEFYNIITQKLNYTCPIKNKKTLPSTRKHTAVNADITALKQKLDDMYKFYKTFKCDIYRNQYNLLRKHYRKLLISLKSEQYEKVIQGSNNKTKCLWKLCNQLRKSQSEENIELVIENNIIQDPITISNSLNDHFTYSSNKIHGDTTTGTNTRNIKTIMNSIYFYDTDATELTQIINHLESKASCGWDGITTKILKVCKQELTPILEHLINYSIKEGTFPNCLKHSTIIPIYKKKGDRRNIENYRPISLTSEIAKLFERVIYKRLETFFETNEVYAKSQHGFRKKLSTTTAISDFLNNVYNKLDERFKVSGIFLDLSHAFDTVSHSILIDKLYKYGIRGIPLELIKSYLTNRVQCTEIKYNKNRKIEKVYSNNSYVTEGVPQGSILGPLFFVIYVSDIPELNNSNIVSYADDTSIVCWEEHSNVLQENLLAKLNSLKQYFADNNLQLNIEKTNLIQFRYSYVSQHIETIKLNLINNIIDETQSVKFLGVYIDSNLNWVSHINYTTKKLSSNLYLLRLLSKYLSTEALLNIYYGIIFPYLAYGIEFWGVAAKEHTDKLFVIQKKSS